MNVSFTHSIPPELADLKVYFGDANPAEARIYAQLPSAAHRAGYQLSGKVIGPYCVYAHTLAVTIPLRNLAPKSAAQTSDSLLAQAILPDPCFWSAELPSLYRVEVELRDRGRIVSSAQVSLGIPALGARGRDLVWQGKRWVLRGARREVVSDDSLERWRDLDLVMDVDDPTGDLCATASRTGVALIARIAGNPTEIASRLHELGRYPAVILAILQTSGPLDPKIRQVAPNLLLGEYFAPNQTIELSPWAHVAICADQDAARLAHRAATSLVPVIAQRRVTELSDLSQYRTACDRLQSDLANQTSSPTSFAGYTV